MIFEPEDKEKTKGKAITLLLRESALVNKSQTYRDTARLSADKLEAAIRNLYDCPTYTNMIEVNCLWITAHKVLSLEPGDSPGGGGGSGDIWEAKHTNVKSEAVAA